MRNLIFILLISLVGCSDNTICDSNSKLQAIYDKEFAKEQALHNELYSIYNDVIRTASTDSCLYYIDLFNKRHIEFNKACYTMSAIDEEMNKK